LCNKESYQEQESIFETQKQSRSGKIRLHTAVAAKGQWGFGGRAPDFYCSGAPEPYSTAAFYHSTSFSNDAAAILAFFQKNMHFGAYFNLNFCLKMHF